MKYIWITMIIMLNLSCLRDPYEEHTTLYVVNDGDKTVSCFNIDYNGTTLDKGIVTLDPEATAGQMYLTIHPNNKFIYIQLQTVSGMHYAVYKPEKDGTLKDYTKFTNPDRNTYFFGIYSDGTHFFSPDGKWHISVNGATNDIFFDSVNQDTGELSKIFTLGTSNWPSCPLIHPDVKYFYVFGTSGNLYKVYSISKTGIPADTTVYNIWNPNIASPDRSVMHPSGKFIYGADSPADSLWLIHVINDGADLNLNTVQYPISSDVNHGVYLHPNGKFVYAMVGTSIYGYKINQSTGVLTSVCTYSLGFTPGLAAFYPDGHWIYITYPAANSVVILNVDNSTGLITPNRTITVGTNPQYIGIGRISKER